MKLNLPREGRNGDIKIPHGEYEVVLNSDAGNITLVGGGKDYKLPATRRRPKSKFKTVQMSFYSGGGVVWSLLVSHPKLGEWITLIELKNDLII